MGKLLRHRWLICRCLDRVAVRGHHAHRRDSGGKRYGTRRPSVFDSHGRSFCHRAVAIGAGKRSLARDHRSCGGMGNSGINGVAYSITVARRMRTQTAYKPVFEDWLFHFLLPIASYATLAISAYAARSHVGGALFGVGTAALLLLFIGIHNAWDAITYHVFIRKAEQHKGEMHP